MKRKYLIKWQVLLMKLIVVRFIYFFIFLEGVLFIISSHLIYSYNCFLSKLGFSYCVIKSKLYCWVFWVVDTLKHVWFPLQHKIVVLIYSVIIFCQKEYHINFPYTQIQKIINVNDKNYIRNLMIFIQSTISMWYSCCG